MLNCFELLQQIIANAVQQTVALVQAIADERVD